MATVSYVSDGTSGNGTTTATGLALPTGWSEGDLFLMHAVGKYTYCDAPSGWTLLAQVNGGNGASGVDTGNVYISVYYRIAQTGDTVPSVTFSGGNSNKVKIALFSKSSGEWSLAATTGTQNTASTTWSITCASNPGITANDMVVPCFAVNGTDATLTGSGYSSTATGATIGTSTTRDNTGVTNGDDLRTGFTTATVSSGTATAAPVFNMTWATSLNANNPAGAVVYVRLRAAEGQVADVTASAVSRAASVPAPASFTYTWADFATERENFDAGTNGNTVGNTDGYLDGTISSSGTPTVQYSNTRSITGSLSLYSLALSGDSWDRYFMVTAPGTQNATAYTCFYIYWIQNAPVTNYDVIFDARNSSNNIIARLAIDTGTPELQMQDGTTNTGTKYAVSTGQWYRIEWGLNTTNDTQELRVWTGATLHSTNTGDAAFISSGGTLADVNATGIHRFRFGNTNSSNAYTREAYWDAIGWRLADWVGPAANSQPAQNVSINATAVARTSAVPSASAQGGTVKVLSTPVAGTTAMPSPTVVASVEASVTATAVARTATVPGATVNSPVLFTSVTATATVPLPASITSSSATARPGSMVTDGAIMDDFFSEVGYIILPDLLTATTSMPRPSLESSKPVEAATLLSSTAMERPTVIIISSNSKVTPSVLSAKTHMPFPNLRFGTGLASITGSQIGFALSTGLDINIKRPETIDRPIQPLRFAVIDTDPYRIYNGFPIAIPKYDVPITMAVSLQGHDLVDREGQFDVTVGSDIRWVAGADYYDRDFWRWRPTDDGLASQYWWATSQEYAPELFDEYTYTVRDSEFTFPVLHFDEDSSNNMWSSFAAGNSSSDEITVMMVVNLIPVQDNQGLYAVLDSGKQTPPDELNQSRETFEEEITGCRTRLQVSSSKLSIMLGDVRAFSPDDKKPTFNSIGILTARFNKAGFWASYVGPRQRFSNTVTETKTFSSEENIHHSFVLGRANGRVKTHAANMNVFELNMWFGDLSESDLQTSLQTLRSVYGIYE